MHGKITFSMIAILTSSVSIAAAQNNYSDPARAKIDEVEKKTVVKTPHTGDYCRHLQGRLLYGRGKWSTQGNLIITFTFWFDSNQEGVYRRIGHGTEGKFWLDKNPITWNSRSEKCCINMTGITDQCFTLDHFETDKKQYMTYSNGQQYAILIDPPDSLFKDVKIKSNTQVRVRNMKRLTESEIKEKFGITLKQFNDLVNKK